MRILRFLKIFFVVTRYRLDVFIPKRLLPWWARFLLFFNPMRIFPQTKTPKEVRLRLALETLGPLFVKFGQILSTRRDLFSTEVIEQLILLQDKVPPFSGEVAKTIVEKELGATIEDIFAEFEITALASASIAQVHAAKLKNGDDVVVKIIRPNIKNIIRKDIQVLYFFARMVLKIFPEAKLLKPVEVVADYETTLFNELDLQMEAANTCQMRRNFKYSDLLYIPAIYWDFTTAKVLVEERIYGVPVGDKQALLDAKVNMHRLAEKGVEIFFTQVFKHNFFHADMHPGNIFVDITNPDNPKYIAIDCGIVGSLTSEDQSYLAQNLLAFFNQNYDDVAQLHMDYGWVGKYTKKNDFANIIRSVCEPMFEKPFDEISFGQVLLVLLQTARKFEMYVQPQLVLLQKTLLNIEGLGRYLHPKLDLWQTAKPFIVDWLKERNSPNYIWEETKKQMPRWLEEVPKMPALVVKNIKEVGQLREDNAVLQRELSQIRQELQTQEKNKFKRIFVLVMAIVVGVFSFNDLEHASEIFASLPNWTGPVAFGLMLIWLFKKMRK